MSRFVVFLPTEVKLKQKPQEEISGLPKRPTSKDQQNSLISPTLPSFYQLWWWTVKTVKAAHKAEMPPLSIHGVDEFEELQTRVQDRCLVIS